MEEITKPALADVGKVWTATGVGQASFQVGGGGGTSDFSTDVITVSPVTNVYTLDLDNKFVKDYKITSTNSTAKSIVLTNVPATADKYIAISILVVMTTACTLTYPSGSSFPNNDAPTYINGDKFIISGVS